MVFERFAVRYRTKITVLISLAFVFVAWYCGPSTLQAPLIATGIFSAAAGTALRLWASGYLIKNEALICCGPFRYVRNPLYLGTLLIGIGFALLSGRWESLAILVLAVALVYMPTIRAEERMLLARFGDAYADYLHTVPRWVPRIGRGGGFPAPPLYRWELVKHHREHLHAIFQMLVTLAFYGAYLLKTP